MLQFILTFGVGVIADMYVAQNYNVPNVRDKFKEFQTKFEQYEQSKKKDESAKETEMKEKEKK